MSGNMTIVDRVVDRIKLQPLGDLIQEEDLYDIIKEAIPKAFFERVTVKDGYGRDSYVKDPAIVEVLREELSKFVSQYMAKWAAENADVIAEYWKKVLDAGLTKYVQDAVEYNATQHVRNTLSSWTTSINQQRINNGQIPFPVVAF